MSTDDAVQKRIDDWKHDLRPRSGVEAFLAEQAAELSCELERLGTVQATRIAHHARTAPEIAASKAYEEVLRIGHRLIDPATDEWVENHAEWYGRRVGRPNSNPSPMLPELAVHLLESSAAGCRWMAGHWVDLSAILDERPAWRPADERKAIRLLGKSPDAEDDAEIRALRLAIKVLKQSPHPHIGPLMVPPTEKTAGRPVPTKAEAKAKLQAICARVIERLRDLAARREAQATLPNAAEETLRHGFDESKEAKELRRRKSTAYREMLKALEMLMKLQKQPAIEESEEPSSGLAATFSHGYAGEGRLAKRRDLSKASADGPRPVTRERVRAAGVRVPGQKQRPNRNRVRSMPPEQLGDRGLSPERGNSPNQTRSLGSNSGALS